MVKSNHWNTVLCGCHTWDRVTEWVSDKLLELLEWLFATKNNIDVLFLVLSWPVTVVSERHDMSSVLGNLVSLRTGPNQRGSSIFLRSEYVLLGWGTEVLITDFKEEDEDGEDQLIFQRVVSPVLIFLGKNGELLNIFHHANFPLDKVVWVSWLYKYIQSYRTEKSKKIRDKYRILPSLTALSIKWLGMKYEHTRRERWRWPQSSHWMSSHHFLEGNIIKKTL